MVCFFYLLKFWAVWCILGEKRASGHQEMSTSWKTQEVPLNQPTVSPKDIPQAGWLCLSIRNTRTVVKHTTHSPFLPSQLPQWETLGTRWAGHGYSLFPPRSWKLVVTLHGNEFHHGLDHEVKYKRDAGRKTGWEKGFVSAHIENTFAHEAHIPLCMCHLFLGILTSHRWSFPSWDHPVKPDVCVYLSHPHHPVQTQAWELYLVRWP